MFEPLPAHRPRRKIRLVHFLLVYSRCKYRRREEDGCPATWQANRWQWGSSIYNGGLRRWRHRWRGRQLTSPTSQNSPNPKRLKGYPRKTVWELADLCSECECSGDIYSIGRISLVLAYLCCVTTQEKSKDLKWNDLIIRCSFSALS